MVDQRTATANREADEDRVGSQAWFQARVKVFGETLSLAQRNRLMEQTGMSAGEVSKAWRNAVAKEGTKATTARNQQNQVEQKEAAERNDLNQAKKDLYERYPGGVPYDEAVRLSQKVGMNPNAGGVASIRADWREGRDMVASQSTDRPENLFRSTGDTQAYGYRNPFDPSTANNPSASQANPITEGPTARPGTAISGPPGSPRTGSGASGGASGGGGSSTSQEETTTAASSGEGEGAVQVPGDYTLMRIDGQAYFAYGHEDLGGTQLLYAATEEEIQALFPSGVPEFLEVNMDQATQTLTTADGSGIPLHFMIGDERGIAALANTSDNPFEGVMELWELRAARMPELFESEGYYELMVEQQLEQMSPELYQERLMALPQFAGRGEDYAARQMAVLAMSDDEYTRNTATTREKVERILEATGVVTSSPNMGGIIDYLTTAAFNGEFGEGQDAAEYLTIQAQALAGIGDPSRMDEGLAQVVEGVDVQALPKQVQQLRNDVEDWLGPAMAANVSDQELLNHARNIADDPNYTGFDDFLKSNAYRTFGAYSDDPDYAPKYSEIVVPYRTQHQQILGEIADESSTDFLSLIQGNDLEASRQQLTRKGYEEGNVRVNTKISQNIVQGFGSGVSGTLL